MEETIKAPTAVFVGRVDDIMYVNLTHEKGITEDTKIDVTDQYCTELATDKVYDLTNYNDINRTLKVNVGSGILDDNYFVKIVDADGTESKITIDTTIEPDALITDNVHVSAHGDRIIEILFDEPVQNFESNFDFAKDRQNQSGEKTYYLNPTLPGNEDHSGVNLKALLYCTDTDGTTKHIVIDDNGTLLKVNANGTVSTTTVTANAAGTTEFPKTTDAVEYYSAPFKVTEVVHPDLDTLKVAAGLQYIDPFSKESNGLSSVLINYYFRYYGSDDEGTLYEPGDKPLDWLGYFSSKDTQTKVSDDNRRFEVQFSDYSLPTGDTHELIINYAKTFPGYTHDFRIKDANDNNFPIVSKTTPIVKWAKKAAITGVKSLSKTELEITFDKAVLCLGNSTDGFELKVNGLALKDVRRTGTTYNVLVAELKVEDALELGPVEVTIGSVTDACGYKTNELKTTVNVIADPPRVINLIYEESPQPDTSVLKIEFDDEMADPIKPIEEHITILEIDDETGNETEITSELVFTLGNPSNKAELEVSNPELFQGRKYRVIITGLTNRVDTVMIPYSDTICIGDPSAPFIESIILTTDSEYADEANKDYRHKVVITYDEPMETEGTHAITVPSNYIVLGNDTSVDWCIDAEKKLPLNSSLAKAYIPSYEISNKRVIIDIFADKLAEKFDTVADYTAYFFGTDIHKISAGYCDLKTVKYVTNESGNILNFGCLKDATLATKIEIGDLSATPDVIEVIDDVTIAVKFSSPTSTNNKIMSVVADDFKIVRTEGSNTIESVALSAEYTATLNAPNYDYVITLKFAPDVLVPNTTLVMTTGKTSDIFDNPVNFDSTPISTGILDRVDVLYTQIVNTSGHLAVLKVEFTDVVKISLPAADSANPTTEEVVQAMELAAHCFALKVGNRDWTSLQKVVADAIGSSITEAANIPAPSTTVYFTYDNGAAIFDNTPTLIATTSAQEKMRVLADSNDEPIEVIPQDEAKEVL